MGFKLTKEEWDRYTTEGKARFYEKANKKHRWVKSLVEQNLDLMQRVEQLERKLNPPQVHVFYITDSIELCGRGRCGKSYDDPVHKVVEETESYA